MSGGVSGASIGDFSIVSAVEVSFDEEIGEVDEDDDEDGDVDGVVDEDEDEDDDEDPQSSS